LEDSTKAIISKNYFRSIVPPSTSHADVALRDDYVRVNVVPFSLMALSHRDVRDSECFSNAIIDIRCGFYLHSMCICVISGLFWQFVKSFGSVENYFVHAQNNF